MQYYSVREAKWITLGAQAKKPGTKGADGKKHGGVAVLIGDDGVILKGPAHMKGKKPDELGGRQKTLGEKPGEKQEPRKYQNLAFGPDGEIAEPDAPKSPPPGTGYADLRAAAAQPAPEPTPSPAPAPAKPAKPAKVPKVAKVAKPEPVAAPTPEPKPEKGETVRAKIARIKAEKEKRYNDTLKKRGKKEADKQKADDKRQAKAEKDALNPAQAEARKKKQVERISKINAARPESLISLVRKEGGISGGDYDYATDIKEFGLKSAMNKRGLKLDDMAKALQNAGHIVVPEGKKAEDVLLAGLQTRANSALHNHTGRYDSEYDDFVNNREDADNAPGADSDRVASVISRGEEAGTDQGDDDSLAQILGLEPNRSDADEPEPSDYGHPDDYEPSDYEPEEGDLGDGGEITGADTSFDFGAPEPAPAPAPSPASPPVDMFGNATTTAKKQPDMMTDMFGARIQAEAPKVTATPTVADDAAKSLDWLDKNDPKKDGSAEMFGSLFSPGASGASAKTQPEAPGEGFADLRAAATQIKEPQRGWTSERQDFHRTGIGGVNTHAGKTADGAAEFDELKNKLGADSGEIASVNLGELYKKHLDAAMQQGGVGKEAFDSAMAEGPTGKNYSRLTALNGEAARRTRAELKEKTGPYIAHNTDGAIAAGYHANPADMVPGATDTDYRRSSAAIITGPETQAKNYKAIYGKPAKAGPALAEPLFGNQPAPAPTPATAPEPGTGYDDLRAAAAKEPEVKTAARAITFAQHRKENGISDFTADQGILSPSGKVSARARKAALDREDAKRAAYAEAEKDYQAKVDSGEISDPSGKYTKSEPAPAPEPFKKMTNKQGLANYNAQIGVAQKEIPKSPKKPKEPGLMASIMAQNKAGGATIATPPPTQKTKGLTDDPEKFQQGDRFKGENGEEFQVFASRQGALTAHPVVDGNPQINKSTEKKFAITDAAAAANPTHRRDFVPGFDQSQPGRDSEEIAQDRARLAKTPNQAPGEGFADLRAAANLEASIVDNPEPSDVHRAAKLAQGKYANRIGAMQFNTSQDGKTVEVHHHVTGTRVGEIDLDTGRIVPEEGQRLNLTTGQYEKTPTDGNSKKLDMVHQHLKTIASVQLAREKIGLLRNRPNQGANKETIRALQDKIRGAGYNEEPEYTPTPPPSPGEGFADLRAVAAEPEATPPESTPPAPEAPATPEAPTSLKVTKGIGYHRQGKTAAPAYLAKISGTHNGKTFNREFQDGDEDTEAKQAAYRKKKGTYSETHDINDGELYEHSQDGDRKLFAVLPSADGKKRREKVSYEMPEISEASRIMGKTKGGASAGTGRGEDIDIPELLAHQHKMALKAGSYKGLTLPDVARDLMASRGGQGEPEPTATPAPAPAPAPTPEPGAGYAELRAAAAAEPEKTPEPTPPAPPKMSPGEKKRQQAEEFEAEKRVLAVLKNNSATHAELRKYTASSKSFDPENPLENPAHAAVDRLLKTGRLVSSGGETPTFSIRPSTPTPATPPPTQKPIDLPPKTPDTTSPGATTAPEPEKSKVEHFSVTASGRGFSQAIALLKKRGGKFNPATKTWAVPTGKVTADDASSFGLQQKAFPQAVRSKRDEDNFGNEDDPERFRVYR